MSNAILATLPAFVVRIINIMAAMVGCQFGTICYTTTCGFPKKSGLQNVMKRVLIKGAQFNYSYQNAVNNRAEKESGAPTNFVAQSLPFGEWVKGLENKIIEHKGEYYLRFYTQKNSITHVTYMENGVPCDANRVAEIKAYLATKTKPVSATQAAAGLTENQVEPKALAISKIHYIIVNGLTISDQQMQVAG